MRLLLRGVVEGIPAGMVHHRIAPASLTIIPACLDACKVDRQAHARNQREGGEFHRGVQTVGSPSPEQHPSKGKSLERWEGPGPQTRPSVRRNPAPWFSVVSLRVSATGRL
ncbi:hypothetical protein VTN77DRAFT_7405 [Rasamsonia byssochlamydoides]|uniref:uncharacterized protein n=1 Tax=Rasamsonia byssochlamydoides TaxID=89139 RepID=UPI003743CED6